jgi:bacterioferritin
MGKSNKTFPSPALTTGSDHAGRAWRKTGSAPEIEMTEANLTDVATLRSRARQNVENGAVTEGYDADRKDHSPAQRIAGHRTGLRAALQAPLLHGQRRRSPVAAEEFLEHATQEAEHADKLAERIVQLGGEPEFNPDLLSKNSHAQYVAGNN